MAEDSKLKHRVHHHLETTETLRTLSPDKLYLVYKSLA
ncbi:hypothetical protein JCM5805K_0517 [Lactococcus lactis subsp. lactis]|uniref:Uncharacterized protein n=1 Tax=Lactococcus lactis subsp. lactis TaxID=1360 RepID=A0A0B8QZM0_LACLL|nr:hypothetical protein RU91_GL000771 [Lactococcus lactis subsp. lactis]GAM79409.1 hypothetical protein JCM5805K_0517 [Lactococcus lactis subsp. lactis]